MAASLTQYGNVSVVTLKEDLVGDEVVSFQSIAERCIDKGECNLVIDCSGVDGVDSAGLEAIVDLQARCEENYGAMKLCGLDATWSKILEITRLARRFESFGDLEAAVKSFT